MIKEKRFKDGYGFKEKGVNTSASSNDAIGKDQKYNISIGIQVK